MKKLKKVRAFSLCLCTIMISQLFTFQVSAKTASELRNEIANYRKELSQLEKNGIEQSKYQSTLSKQIDALSQQMQEFDNQIDELNIQIDEKQTVIDKLNEQIFDNELQICKMKTDIDGLESDKNFTEDQLRERMKENYLYEQSGPLEVLLSSQDFGEFISNIIYLQKVAEFDNKLMEKLDMQIDEINTEKSKVEDVVTKINRSKDVVVSALDEVQGKVSEINKAKESKKSVSDELSSQLKKSTIQSANIEQAKKRVQKAQSRAKCELENPTNAIRSLQNKNRGNFKGPVDTGGYIYPVDGSSKISPDRRFNPSIPHYGIDILTYGQHLPVVASRGGTVIVSRFGLKDSGYGGYGNVVVISHGDRYSTLYGHMLTRYVNVGDEVSRGQCIGLVGNTGDSSCIHLHFEVRHHGDPIPTPFEKD